MAEIEGSLRQLLILRILGARKHGATLDELASEMGAHRRTIQRDLEKAMRAGVHLQSEMGPHGKKIWKISEATRVPGLQFTLEEVSALYLGRQFLEPLVGTLFHTGAQNAFRKIRASLGEAGLRHLDNLATTVYLKSHGLTDYTQKGELIDALQVAVEESRLIAIEYRSLRTTEPVTHYDVCPYAMVHHKGALYLVGSSKSHDDEIRTFKIDRISGFQMLELKFRRPPDFNVAAYLESSFGIFSGDGPPQYVRVRFDSSVGRLLEEKRFHPSQKIFRDGGAVLAEFHLANFEEFISWILSFGPTAEVLEPQELRDEVKNRVIETSMKYDLSKRPKRQLL